jgi:hypothetical protein
MHPLSPALLMATANGLTGFGEDDFERGRMVWRFLRAVNEQHDAPWSAAFIYHAGYWSHFNGVASSWPLPATGSPDRLARFAAERGVLSGDLSGDAGRGVASAESWTNPDDAAGEIALFWSAQTRTFVRAGIVAGVDLRPTVKNGQLVYSIETIEGNTSEAGCTSGPWIHRVRRSFCPGVGDRSIRWFELDSRECFSDPTKRNERVPGRLAPRRAA